MSGFSFSSPLEFSFMGESSSTGFSGPRLALGFAGGLFFLCREFFPAKRSNEQDKNEN
jgi:hypothetical protein